MSGGTRNFTLRLSAADERRLGQAAAHLHTDRTGALRWLIRHAGIGWGREGCFTVITRGGAGRTLPMRLKQRSEHGHESANV